MKPFISVVLHEPEIPQNAGNIARLCACTNVRLILVGKLGFSMSNKYMKRSGLDYWDKVEILKFVSYRDFLCHVEQTGGNIYYFTTHGEKPHYDFNFKDGDYFVFGSESKGLPDWIMELDKSSQIRLPMYGELRSLNLSNTVAVAVYEAIRQIQPEF